MKNDRDIDVDAVTTIGMPRSLLYFKFYPLWKTFLEELGCEIVLSPHTNKKIVERGVDIGMNELCLPIKIYYGHMAWLLENHPDLDYIFVPRYISLDPRGFYCPKFLSLPDAMRGTFDKLPKLLVWEVNAKEELKISWAIRFGRQLGANVTDITTAYQKAVHAYKEFNRVIKGGIFITKALDAIEKGQPLPDPRDLQKHPVTIFVLGHPYNVYEDYTNMNMLEKLEKMGVNVMALENLSPDVFKDRVKVGGKFDNYWGNEQDILQATRYLFENNSTGIDGVIFIISFACGPDSLIAEIVMRDMQAKKVPYISLVVDEHSGSAGLVTRIETFVDMIMRKKQIQYRSSSKIFKDQAIEASSP
jgi:predicted nucleotide-binding protein (sugar kinase/HSP70/actin superfamily)